MIEKKQEFIYGTRAVLEAVNAGKQIEKIILQQGLSNPLINELRNKLNELHIPFQQVPLSKIQQVTRGNHQGVVAWLSLVEYQQVEDLIPLIFDKGESPLFIMLDRVTDVRNLGAIARTAACTGVHAIIIPEHGSARINADAIKTSAGALHTIPVCREKNLKHAIEYMKSSGIKIFAATEKATITYFKSDLAAPCCIIMGSEGEGISGEYLKRADERITIPMQPTVASLNVSVAAGVILFEAYRQRNK